jgi:hypothetical protein
MLAARIVAVFAVLFAVLGLVAGFIRWQALDNETFEQTAELMIADDDVRNQIAATLVDELYANVDVAEGLEERLPEGQQALAPILAGAIRELSDRAARRLLERPRAQEAWVRSLSVTHEQLLRLLDDELTAVQTEGGYLVLDLRPLVIQLGDQVAVVGRLAERLPADTGRIEVMEADQLETAQDLTQLLRTLAWVFPFLALGLGALAVWLATGRRRAILGMLGWGFVLAGVLVLVIRRVAGSYVVDELARTESGRPAVESAWEIVTRLLVDGAWSLIILGGAAVLGVLLTGGGRYAAESRRRLAPILARPEYAYGAAAALLLLLVWWAPIVQFRRGLYVLVTAILLGIGVEALRRVTGREFPPASST